MKIERISENQIRCTLSSFDLSIRNLDLGELAYGSEKARSLFREMIQKASSEVGFEVEDIPLMVEAIPLSNESVMLVITKIEDPEELDTRFAKFSPTADDDPDNFLIELANEVLEGANELKKSESADPPSEKKKEEKEKTESTLPSLRIYDFQTLDFISDAAKAVGHVYAGENTLYKKPKNGHYYLIVKNSSNDSLEFSRLCNILAEYGTKVRHDYASEAYYKEHYEIIIKNHALQALSQI